MKKAICNFKINRFSIFQIVFFASAFFISHITWGDSKWHENELKPDVLMSNISKYGARDVAKNLYASHEKWDHLLEGIATGEDEWIKLAAALYSGTDAGSSEMVKHSLGEALEQVPVTVFKYALGTVRLEDICGSPDIDDVRYNSYELAIEAIERRRKRILSIGEGKFKNVAEQCAFLLVKSKDEVAKFFQKKE